MAAPRNFVTGFNHNIKHRGQVFHVQTEDSGAEIAAITTHLFVGGTILSSRRHTYAELRQLPDLRDRVRALMEEQHKAMLRSLVRGEFDHLIEGVRAYQPGEIDAGPTAPAAAPVAPVQPEAPMLDLDGAVDVEITLDELEIEEWNSEPPPQRQVTPPRGTPLTPQPWGRGARSPCRGRSAPACTTSRFAFRTWSSFRYTWRTCTGAFPRGRSSRCRSCAPCASVRLSSGSTASRARTFSSARGAR